MAGPSAATSIVPRSSTKKVQCGLPMLHARRRRAAAARGCRVPRRASRQPVSGLPISTVIRPFASVEHTRYPRGVRSTSDDRPVSRISSRRRASRCRSVERRAVGVPERDAGRASSRHDRELVEADAAPDRPCAARGCHRRMRDPTAQVDDGEVVAIRVHLLKSDRHDSSGREAGEHCTWLAVRDQSPHDAVLAPRIYVILRSPTYVVIRL